MTLKEKIESLLTEDKLTEFKEKTDSNINEATEVANLKNYMSMPIDAKIFGVTDPKFAIGKFAKVNPALKNNTKYQRYIMRPDKTMQMIDSTQPVTGDVYHKIIVDPIKKTNFVVKSI